MYIKFFIGKYTADTIYFENDPFVTSYAKHDEQIESEEVGKGADGIKSPLKQTSLPSKSLA